MPSAAILAGGRSRRFGGRDKSSLLVGGVPILRRQVEEISRITDDILVVGGNEGTAVSAGPLPRFIPDRVKDSGPLGGLDSALAFARDDSVVVVACDMPHVSAALLGYLLSVLADADAVVPRTSRGYHPLCAVYARACQAAVQARLSARRLSMVGLLDDLRVRVVGEQELEAFGRPDDLLANVNSPAEFRELAGLSGHQL